MKTPAPGGNRERAAVIETPDDTAACTRSRTLVDERDLYALAHRVLAYDAVSGEFRFKRSTGNRRAGDRAGSVRPDGMRHVCVGRHFVLASRLAVLMSFGTWPAGQLVHRNGQLDDDRLANLQSGDGSQACAGQGLRSNSRTGRRGVSIAPGGRGFVASITVARRQRYLGTYPTVDAAAAAYEAAALEAWGSFYRRQP